VKQEEEAAEVISGGSKMLVTICRPQSGKIKQHKTSVSTKILVCQYVPKKSVFQHA